MNRKVERLLCRLGGIWNIVTGSITLFFYSSWVKNNLFEGLNRSTKGLNFLSENLHLVVMTFGLIVILAGVVNLFIASKMADNQVMKKAPLWLFLWGLVSFFTVDILGVLFYLPASFLLLSKNKLISSAADCR